MLCPKPNTYLRFARASEGGSALAPGFLEQHHGLLVDEGFQLDYSVESASMSDKWFLWSDAIGD